MPSQLLLSKFSLNKGYECCAVTYSYLLTTSGYNFFTHRVVYSISNILMNAKLLQMICTLQVTQYVSMHTLSLAMSISTVVSSPCASCTQPNTHNTTFHSLKCNTSHFYYHTTKDTDVINIEDHAYL